MSNDAKSKTLDSLLEVFSATDQTISEWDQPGRMQFKDLFNSIAEKMSWSEKQIKEHDPLIRFYIRNNPSYQVSRGPKGGVQKLSPEDTSSLSEKDSLKKKMKELIEAKFQNQPLSNNQAEQQEMIEELSESVNPENQDID